LPVAGRRSRSPRWLLPCRRPSLRLAATTCRRCPRSRFWTRRFRPLRRSGCPHDPRRRRRSSRRCPQCRRCLPTPALAGSSRQVRLHRWADPLVPVESCAAAAPERC
jgi:hypothetical protein